MNDLEEITIGQTGMQTTAGVTGWIMDVGYNGLIGFAPAAATAVMTRRVTEGPVKRTRNMAVGTRRLGPKGPMLGRVDRILNLPWTIFD